MKRPCKAGKVSSGGFSLNVFSEDELHEIHLGTLEILKDTGVFVESEEARQIFKDGGARINEENRVVTFPPYLVEKCIRSAPETFHAYGRIPESDVVLEGKRVTFTNFGEGIMFVDPYTGEHRKTTKKDIEMAARVIDYLDHVETYERCMLSHDRHHSVQALHNAEASLTNTTKHHWLGPVDRYQCRKIIEICWAIAGGEEKFRERPFLTFVTCPISPLRLSSHHCEIIIEAARNGMGVNCIAMAMSGGSSPIHIAGTLVQQNAELLASLVLGQLVQEGASFIYASSTCPLDMKNATASVGSPETGIINAGVAQIANYYNLPSFAAGG
ncbi:trimethylamine---corrinoid protein Co-methyltransferase [Desulforhopalus singaporensis]|uniref:Trimethylamine---corrinoid protein Co-methyltransferase n=1 Tax=Desulforhopalus singaporensis TaxID=91360 RepID=A0A1H0RYC7_9BACT|nr:trimethylamine---corrinoid protein Co-methyltransferase [Desulforhopalus singaporensis]